MRASLVELSESFIKNRDIIKQGFAWENSYLYPICAAIFTDKRKTADVERMKECRDILKSKNGIFSDFRGISMLPMMAMMASSDAVPLLEPKTFMSSSCASGAAPLNDAPFAPIIPAR